MSETLNPIGPHDVVAECNWSHRIEYAGLMIGSRLGNWRCLHVDIRGIELAKGIRENGMIEFERSTVICRFVKPEGPSVLVET